MYEEIAWNSFYKTGNIESFLEYKYLKDSIIVGENKIERNKSKGNSDKRDSL